MLRLTSRRAMAGALSGMLIATLGGVAVVPSTRAGAETVSQFTRLSTTSGAKQIPAGATDAVVSADGKYLAFTSDDEGLPGGDGFSTQVYVKNLNTGTVVLVSQATGGGAGDDSSYMPAISSNGRYVAFYSDSDTLDSRDENFSTDVYLRDRDADNDGIFDETGAGAANTKIASYHSGLGADFGVNTDAPPSLSDDGAYVAFTTDHPFVVNDENDDDDVYVKIMAGGMRWISRSGQGDNSGGGGSNGHMSADGRFVVFQSPYADILPVSDPDIFSDVFLYDRDPNGNGFDGADLSTTKVSLDTGGANPNGASTQPVISADGSTIAFVTAATDIVAAGQPGVVVRDRVGATSTWASPAFGGAPTGVFGRPALDQDGSVVAYSTTATNLGADTNGLADIYRFADGDVLATLLTDPTGTAVANGSSSDPSLVADGAKTVFTSSATNLVSNDTNNAPDAYLHTFVDDTSAPVVTMVRPTERWTTGLTSRASWSATDPSGVASEYGVQRGVARWNQAGVTWTDLGDIAATSSTLDPNVGGRTYCWRARATDLVGNTSAYTAPKCQATPLTATAASYGPKWERVTVSDAYRGALIRTTSNGAKATLEGVRARRIAVVATTCSTCGSIRVRWNGSPIGSVNLVTSSRKRQQLFEIKAFATTQTGTLVVEVTSPNGKTVALEGIGAFQPAS